MGHVALSNIIMIVQSGSLMYTFLNNKGSISTWSVNQVLLALSLTVDTYFHMFLWYFSYSYCYYYKAIRMCAQMTSTYIYNLSSLICSQILKVVCQVTHAALRWSHILENLHVNLSIRYGCEKCEICIL